MSGTDITMLFWFCMGVIAWQGYGYITSGEAWSWKYWKAQLATFVTGFAAQGFKIVYLQGFEIPGENDWTKWFLAGIATAYAITKAHKMARAEGPIKPPVED